MKLSQRAADDIMAAASKRQGRKWETGRACYQVVEILDSIIKVTKTVLNMLQELKNASSFVLP